MAVTGDVRAVTCQVLWVFLEKGLYPDLLKVKIAAALELEKSISKREDRNLEIAERLRDQLGSVSVLAEQISEIAWNHLDKNIR